MIQGRSSLSLALETSKCLWIMGYIFWQEFQCDESMEASVFGLVDDAHPATTQLLEDAVVRDVLHDHCGEMLGHRKGKSMKVPRLATCERSVGVKSHLSPTMLSHLTTVPARNILRAANVGAFSVSP